MCKQNEALKQPLTKEEAIMMVKEKGSIDVVVTLDEDFIIDSDRDAIQDALCEAAVEYPCDLQNISYSILSGSEYGVQFSISGELFIDGEYYDEEDDRPCCKDCGEKYDGEESENGLCPDCNTEDCKECGDEYNANELINGICPDCIVEMEENLNN